MIKRIIFDLDNTIIDWKEEYWKTLNSALDKCGIKYSQEDITKTIESVDAFEDEYEMYKKEYMAECMSKYSGLNIDVKFIDIWLEELAKCIPSEAEEDVIETLDYLYKKYELVILTNWFKKSQNERLENLGIKKYFKEIYTPENYKIKPSKESFEVASNNNINECIMVGDSLKTDIEGALNVGMNAIYYNRKKEKVDNNKIEVITEFKQLTTIL